MTRKSKSTYTGALAKPRQPWGPLSLIDTEQEIERRKTAETEDFLNKLELVLDHYGIKRDSPTAFLQLLHALLLAHVPGFQVRNGRGKKVFWDVHRKVDLVFDVQLVINTGKLASAAFENRELMKQYRAKDPDSLRRRYEEARRAPVITAFEAMAKHSEGRLSFAEIAEIHHETKAEFVRE
jgi:hypothetical protein